ncbi:hypothetical protein NC652_023415 [Populus alba x Populus x berolinensis]|nr:hypothetical protein NC652_023415 [Populus alba x Populus x berolinensis]
MQSLEWNAYRVGPKLLAFRIYFWDSSGFSCPVHEGADYARVLREEEKENGEGAPYCNCSS